MSKKRINSCTHCLRHLNALKLVEFIQFFKEARWCLKLAGKALSDWSRNLVLPSMFCIILFFVNSWTIFCPFQASWVGIGLSFYIPVMRIFIFIKPRLFLMELNSFCRCVSGVEGVNKKHEKVVARCLCDSFIEMFTSIALYNMIPLF
ncbi:hypothetical protein BpHYR1_011717 [Brachionus plicatilis]|uniref:Uncharacterized protein n=1 Tax=Brachionus plicatilis TaxID=10195 RepID=A0A3M7SK84_BRAPC|nr:hypothetical protein BpHYR1_011717 [Brachionus plicatilis]